MQSAWGYQATSAMQQQWSGMQAQLIASAPQPSEAMASAFSKAQTDLSAAASSVVQATTVDGAPAGSHFGAQALQRSVSMLSDWVMSTLAWVETSEPDALNGLSGAFDELKSAAQLLTTMPGMNVQRGA